MLSICPTILTDGIKIKSTSLTNVPQVSIAQTLWSDASTTCGTMIKTLSWKTMHVCISMISNYPQHRA